MAADKCRFPAGWPSVPKLEDLTEGHPYQLVHEVNVAADGAIWHAAVGTPSQRQPHYRGAAGTKGDANRVRQGDRRDGSATPAADVHRTTDGDALPLLRH